MTEAVNSVCRAARLAVPLVVALLGVPASAGADPYQRWVDVVNEGRYAIWSVRISHVDDGRWGPDLLGGYVIEPGQVMRVEPVRNQGYCRFDVQVTYETGQVVTLWGVNLCEAIALFASDAGYTQVRY
jgi:hypothetical protein